MGCTPSKPQAKEVFAASVVPTKPSMNSSQMQVVGRVEKAQRQATLISKTTLTRHTEGGLSPDYELRETLNYSPFSQLKKAIYLPTGDPRAVKIIHKASLDQDTLDQGGNIREIEALKRLDHPGVVRMVEVGVDKYRVYIVREEATGLDLLNFVEERPEIAHKNIRSILHQLLTTLNYCHSQGVFLLTLHFEGISLNTVSEQVSIRLTDFSTAIFDGEQGRKDMKRASVCTAPEVFKGEGGGMADIWSCGVVLHVLLFGRPPYLPSSPCEMLPFIQRGDLSLSDTSFLDPSLRSLLTGLLEKSPKARLTAAQALSNPWLSELEGMETGNERVGAVVSEMRTFRAAYKLKDAICTFLSFQAVSSVEMVELREAFLSLDKNSDGRVSREELMDYYKEKSREIETIHAVEDMLSQIDSDNSGFIEYSEFLKATLNKRKYLSKQYLALAFQSFDVDHSGKISLSDLRAICNSASKETESLLREVMEEADFNKDGEIDLAEFQTIALKKF